MSTPCLVTFDRHGGTIYKHWDGHPDSMEIVFEKFLARVESATSDTRFNDAPYLAAKFVVFLADEYRDEGAESLNFLSVGVVDPTIDWGEAYHYFVHCTPDGKRPTLSETR